ncbi:MAG: radical SAM protein [Candidatus Omnitrophica bacterium]|nr:radical SAM protein [Candidatus Omnitrophota bacterium]
MILPENGKNKGGLGLALVMCPGWGVIQPPVGISYLKSYLEGYGKKVKCFDLSLELYKVFPEKRYWDLNYPEHFILPQLFQRDVLPSLKPYLALWAEEILRYNPKVVGFSLFMSSVNTSLLLAKELKKAKADLLIVAGGAEVTRAKRVAADGICGFTPINDDIFTTFDLLIDGEGEEALLEILCSLERGEDVYSAKGICYLKGNKVIANNTRALIEDLDVLPPPDFSDFKLGEYTRAELPFVTSRGCVNRCTFCADSPLWKVYRHQSPRKVFEEIQFLVRHYGRNQFEIVDSTFNGNVRRVGEICDLIIKSKLNIQWSAKVTLREEMDLPLLEKMKKAGCSSLAYGVESGSPRVLKNMRKNTNLDTAKRIIRHTHRVGIQANCFFIIGYPTETEEDFQMTLNFIEENARFIYRFDQVTGCHLEEDSYLGLNLEKYGIELKDDGWYSKDSTPSTRKARYDRFRKLARKLHKHYECEVQA